jgi:hypothetical protein
MAAPRDRRHILIRTPPGREPYTPHRRKMQPPAVPAPPDRRRHAAALKGSLRDAQRQAQQRREDAEIEVHGAQPGLYVEFDSQPGVDLKVESLAHKGLGIELVAVTRQEAADGKVTERATVFVPDGAVKHFISRFDQYATERSPTSGEPRHKAMVDPIAALRLATLRALWTDAPEAYPREGEAIWWEVWLRRQDGRELERLVEFAGLVDIQLRDRRLEFHDRIVTLAFATPERLAGSLDVLNDLAELRRAKDAAGVFADMGPREQADWLRDLQGRTIPAPRDAPAVCVLDTGVNRAHPLLEPSPPHRARQSARALRRCHRRSGEPGRGPGARAAAGLLDGGHRHGRARPGAAHLMVSGGRRARSRPVLRSHHAGAGVPRPRRSGAAPVRRLCRQCHEPRSEPPRPERHRAHP